MSNQCCAATPEEIRRARIRHRTERLPLWVRDPVGTLYRRFAYRAVMRAVHRLGWCGMKRMPRIEAGERDRFWCQWCGMRGAK